MPRRLSKPLPKCTAIRCWSVDNRSCRRTSRQSGKTALPTQNELVCQSYPAITTVNIWCKIWTRAKIWRKNIQFLNNSWISWIAAQSVPDPVWKILWLVCIWARSNCRDILHLKLTISSWHPCTEAFFWIINQKVKKHSWKCWWNPNSSSREWNVLRCCI